MSRGDVVMVIIGIMVVIAGLFFAARLWKRGADRSAVILNIRNCQQAMRGHSGMKQLSIGDSFTREDLEEYMTFPRDRPVPEGVIRYSPGTEVTPVREYLVTGDPGDHLWLKLDAPLTENYVGRYGFERIRDSKNW